MDVDSKYSSSTNLIIKKRGERTIKRGIVWPVLLNG